MRAVVLAVLVALFTPGVVLFTPSVAFADTLTVGQYQQRLGQAHDALVAARGGPLSTRAARVADAQALLRRTDALALPSGGTLAVDDTRLLANVTDSDASLDAAIARLNARAAIVAGIGAPAIDPAVADARLRDITRQSGGAGNADLFDLLGRILLRFISGLQGPGVDLQQLVPALGLLGIAVILFVVATLGRALPERVRGEVLARGAAAEAGADPLVHLRAAEVALAGGRTRDALHAFYLYVIAALAARDVIRYDPALTDRELLARATAIPHAEALRDLVGIYERSWFGLREPSPDEARRARELALRVAP